jgi:ABC-type transporter Mla MlaB component
VQRHTERAFEAVDAVAPGDGGLAIAPLPDRVGLRLSGDADLGARRALEKALAAFAGRDTDVHLELGGLAFVDVGAVTALVRAAGRCVPGRRIVLHEAPDQLRQIMTLLWGQVPAIEMDQP